MIFVWCLFWNWMLMMMKSSLLCYYQKKLIPSPKIYLYDNCREHVGAFFMLKMRFFHPLVWCHKLIVLQLLPLFFNPFSLSLIIDSPSHVWEEIWNVWENCSRHFTFYLYIHLTTISCALHDLKTLIHLVIFIWSTQSFLATEQLLIVQFASSDIF